MSDLIAFLERVGADAQLRQAGQIELSQVVAASGLDARARDALLAGDVRTLAELLEARPVMRCAFAPKDDEEEKEDEDDDRRDDDEIRHAIGADPDARSH